MTAKEALLVFEKRKRCAEFENCGYRHTKCDYWVDADELKEAEQKAVEALEKQIPKKAVGEHYAHMRCPSCNHRIPSGQGSSSRRCDNWCNYCGQKIDWSEGEE